MAIRVKNFLKKKLNRLRSGLKADLHQLLAQGQLEEAIKRCVEEAKLDVTSATEVVMALQSEVGRSQLRQQAGQVGSLLKDELLGFLSEGETAGAVEWCVHEAGIDPKAAKLVVEHLRDETPTSLKDKATKSVDTLEAGLRRDLDELLIEGKTIEALKLLRQEKGLSLAAAKAILDRLRDEDVPDAHECLIERKLGELGQAVKADVLTKLEKGHGVTALQQLKSQTGLDLGSSRDLLEKLQKQEDIKPQPPSLPPPPPKYLPPPPPTPVLEERQGPPPLLADAYEVPDLFANAFGTEPSKND